jgi:hypothetical protein
VVGTLLRVDWHTAKLAAVAVVAGGETVVAAVRRQNMKESRLGKRLEACHIAETAHLVPRCTAAAGFDAEALASTMEDIGHYMEAGNSSPVDAGWSCSITLNGAAMEIVKFNPKDLPARRNCAPSCMANPPFSLI